MGWELRGVAYSVVLALRFGFRYAIYQLTRKKNEIYNNMTVQSLPQNKIKRFRKQLP